MTNLTQLPFDGIRYVGGEIRLGGFSFQVGFAVTSDGRIFAYGSGGAPVGIVATDSGAFSDPQLALALGIAAVVSGKNAIVFGTSSQDIDSFIDYTRPTITFNAHYGMGVDIDIEGKSYEFSFGPGFALPGLQVNVTSGFQVGNFWSSPLGFAVLVHKFLTEAISPTPSECFPSGTRIEMSDGTHKSIEEIAPHDVVMAFHGGAALGRGALLPRSVTRCFTNITDEWIILRSLTFEKAGFSEITVTPGHRFLATDGKFRRVDVTCPVSSDHG